MNGPNAVLHGVSRWLGLALLVSFIGCVGAPTPRPQVLTLPAGVNSNPNQYLQQSEALVPDRTKKRWRPCQGADGGCSVSVEIVTLYTDPIRHESPPAAGMLAARLKNLSPTHNEVMYGLRPSTQATYFLWVDRKPDTNKTRWTLLRVPTPPSGGQLVTAEREETLELCHEWGPGESYAPDVDFAEYKHQKGDACLQLAENTAEHSIKHASAFTFQPLAKFIAGFASVTGRRPPAPAGIWFACSDGCCR